MGGARLAQGDAGSLTTSNGEPPLSLHDPNPDRPVQRFVGVPIAKLLEEHRKGPRGRRSRN